MKAYKLLILPAFLLASGAAQAESPFAGAWKVTIGSAAAPCEVTLSNGAVDNAGSAAPASACTGSAAGIARWSSARPGQLTLKSAGGATIAVLNAEGETYSGKQFADNRKVVLSR